MHLVRALAPPRLAAGVFVALALLTTACSNDVASGVTAPPLDISLGKGAPPPSASFAVLANANVTCTGGHINGDVGTYQAKPTGKVTQTPAGCVKGKVDVGDAAAKTAYNNFLSTYAALAPKPLSQCTPLTGTLAGQKLAPGVYCVAPTEKTGKLTLDGPANGVWTFTVAGALTGTNFVMVMAGHAQACNVTWWVANGATMTDSNFQGNLLGGEGITLTRGTFNGNAWATADFTTTGTKLTGCS